METPTAERQKYLFSLGKLCIIEDNKQPDGFNMKRPVKELMTDNEWEWLQEGYHKTKKKLYK